ncbi:sigma-70 family RNA polymerase sigma factor [Neosynechococcus sphagnicola]|uniref:sigma-70 family RNA polymerase sigma factor n=1 Tax=Neosynechococcus sphagnicola TaxID=1501145 RepID=UPI00056C03CD|nr:sigma-70 family RNA polymerase sigma factor [Neosynechococcus sphagnicola]
MPESESSQEHSAESRSINRDQFIHLYDTYGQQMYSLALRMLENAQEAEDLIQDVFLGLWKQFNFDPQRGSLKTFLLVLVRSRALDRIRTRKVSQKLLQQQKWETNFLSDLSIGALQNEETIQQVRAAIAQLPEQQRHAIELAYFKGLSQSEISERLGMPLGTVKSWFRLGFRKLRTELGNNKY